MTIEVAEISPAATPADKPNAAAGITARRIGHDAVTLKVGFEAASPVMKYATLPSPAGLSGNSPRGPAAGVQMSKARSDRMVGAPVVLNIAVAIHKLDRARPLAPLVFALLVGNSIWPARKPRVRVFGQTMPVRSLRPRLRARRRPIQELMQHFLCRLGPHLAHSNRTVDGSTNIEQIPGHLSAASRADNSSPAVPWLTKPLRPTSARIFYAPRHYVPRGREPAPGIFRSRDTDAVTP
jgi:hypothetical protein